MRAVARVETGLRVATGAMVLVCLVGASCGTEGAKSGTPEAAENAGPALSGVDLGRLTDSERRLFRRLIDDQLSPCGDPVSLRSCVSENRACAACRPAVRYIQRLVTDGYGRSDIENRLETRYGEDGAARIPVGDAAVRGSAMAPITVVEFSDFECPACGAAHPLVAAALTRFPDKVRLVMLNYPLPSHPFAGEAARAAVAAGKQNKFWEMHDLLFEHQHELSRERVMSFATDLALDVERFEEDLESDPVQAQVEGQVELGHRLGVDGTPTFFVNGRKFLDHPRTLGEYLKEEINGLE